MKILTTRSFNDLMARIEKLEMEALIYTRQKDAPVYFFGVEFPKLRKISLHDAVLALADHCGVEFIKTDAVPSVAKVKRRSK